MLTTSDKGYAVIRSFEGRALKAYKDCVGVWTIGYGQTNSDAEVLGFKVEAGVTITPEQCEQLLKTSITRRYEPAVRKSMGPDCTQQALDAGSSFHYNTGAIDRASWVKSYVAKAMQAVHAQIMQWNKGGGSVLAGLTRRRNREWEMIDRGDYGPEGSEVARDLHTGKPIAPTAAADEQPGAGTYPGTMRLGDQGPEVKDEQAKLRACGYPLVPLTGKFEEHTEEAVRDFQSRHPQLRKDGRLGPATRVALQRDADAKSKLKGTATKGGGTGTVIVGADQATGGHLPLWVSVGIGLVVLGSLAWIAWQYRDEIRAMLKSKFAS